MHPDFIQLIELGVGIVMLLGIGGCAKLLVWDLPVRLDSGERLRTRNNLGPPRGETHLPATPV